MAELSAFTISALTVGTYSRSISFPQMRWSSVVFPTPPNPIILTFIEPKIILSKSFSKSKKSERFPAQLPSSIIDPYFSKNLALIVLIFEFITASSSSRSVQTTIIMLFMIV